MLRRERLALIGVDHPGLATQHLFQGQVGRIAPIREGEHVTGVVLDLREQGVEGDAFPVRVQFGPLGHAVDIFRHCLARQGMKFVPGPALRLIDLPHNGEIPGRERGMRRRPCREHGKAALEILSRWDSAALVTFLATTAEPPREETFTHVFTSCSFVAFLMMFLIISYVFGKVSQDQALCAKTVRRVSLTWARAARAGGVSAIGLSSVRSWIDPRYRVALTGTPAAMSLWA